MATDTQKRLERATTQATTPAQPEPYDPGTRVRSPRGRHRKPRPRKMLLAAGGLAVAAGVLSLVRLTPDPNVQSLGTAETEPGPDTDTGTDRPTNTAATTGSTPEVSPSATAPVRGGPGATPLPGRSLAHTPYATAAPGVPAAVPTTIPDAPNPTDHTAGPTTAPRPPASTPTTARPTPTPPPSRTTPPPAPQPDQPNHPDRPDLCVPIIDVCVDPPTTRHN
jgi:hypothetical protein